MYLLRITALLREKVVAEADLLDLSGISGINSLLILEYSELIINIREKIASVCQRVAKDSLIHRSIDCRWLSHDDSTGDIPVHTCVTVIRTLIVK